MTDQYTTQYAVETLVTDTLCWEIVSRTARTLQIRPAKRTGEILERRRTGAFDGITYAVEPDPTAEIRTVRIDKEGFACSHRGARSLRAVETGFEYVDYSF